jgi:hypothetical protein
MIHKLILHRYKYIYTETAIAHNVHLHATCQVARLTKHFNRTFILILITMALKNKRNHQYNKRIRKNGPSYTDL